MPLLLINGTSWRDRFFFDLDIGLPLEQLRGIIRTCQAGKNDYQELILKAIDRRGKTIDY